MTLSDSDKTDIITGIVHNLESQAYEQWLTVQVNSHLGADTTEAQARQDQITAAITQLSGGVDPSLFSLPGQAQPQTQQVQATYTPPQTVTGQPTYTPPFIQSPPPPSG